MSTLTTSSAIIRKQTLSTEMGLALNRDLRACERNPMIDHFHKALLIEEEAHGLTHSAVFRALSFDKPVLDEETFLFSCRTRMNIHPKSMTDGDLRDVFADVTNCASVLDTDGHVNQGQWCTFMRRRRVVDEDFSGTWRVDTWVGRVPPGAWVVVQNGKRGHFRFKKRSSSRSERINFRADGSTLVPEPPSLPASSAASRSSPFAGETARLVRCTGGRQGIGGGGSCRLKWSNGAVWVRASAPAPPARKSKENPFSMPVTTSRKLMDESLGGTMIPTEAAAKKTAEDMKGRREKRDRRMKERQQRMAQGYGGGGGDGDGDDGCSTAYEFFYRGRVLQEFVVPASRVAYWVDVRGAYGGGWGACVYLAVCRSPNHEFACGVI